MSLAVARLVTPMIAAYFLKSFGHAKHGEGWMMDAYMKILRWTLDSRVAKARAAGRGFFGRARARFRDHRLWVLGLGLASFLLTIVMFGVLPKQFPPGQDDDSSTVRVEMVPGPRADERRAGEEGGGTGRTRGTQDN